MLGFYNALGRRLQAYRAGLVFQQRPRQAQICVRLVYRTVGVDARMVLFDTISSEEPCRAVVARTGVDFHSLRWFVAYPYDAAGRHVST